MINIKGQNKEEKKAIEKKIKEIGWLYDYRYGGKYIGIERDKIQVGDIHAGNIFQYKVKRNNQILIVDTKEENDIQIDKFPHQKKILVYRGGKTVKAVNVKKKKD